MSLSDKTCADKKSSRSHKRSLTASLAGIMFAGFTMQAALAAQTQSYVVSWFYNGTYSVDGDCPDGINPLSDTWIHKVAVEQGVPKDVIEKEFLQFNPLDEKGPIPRAIIYRARVDGKPANVYANPGATKDPNIHIVKGPHALGFNLDGKGAGTPGSFEDPYTHEKGVDNQAARAIGCIETERTAPGGRPNFPSVRWDLIRDTIPAWVITLTGEDLSKDGLVKVTFDRALEHVSKDASGQVLADSTFRLNPNPRFHFETTGKIEKGMLTTTTPFDLVLVSEQMFIPEMHIKQTHVRIALKPEGSSIGLLGGYMPWREFYWQYPMVGFQGESMVGYDVAGIYHALRKLADAEPDPKTGENTHISVSFYMEVVPAFAVKAKTETAAK